MSVERLNLLSRSPGFSPGFSPGKNGGKTVPGHSTPRITQRPERQFTSGLMSVKDLKESFCTHQSACELSLWSLSYCSSKIDSGKQGGGELSLGQFPHCDSHPAISLVFGGCTFPPVSLGPAGDCPCRD